MRHKYNDLLKRYYFYLGSDQPYVPWIGRVRSVVGVFIGIMFVASIAKFLGELGGLDEWLFASIGASALLVFVMPSSPMAQPWAVIAGNALSALVGISVIHVISEPLVAIPFAASLPVLVMFVLRCLHPPAAAVAMIMVMGDVMQYRYAVFPVGVDPILLVLVGVF